MHSSSIIEHWARMTKYGRRYYDEVCQCCCYPRRSVFLFRGICLSCLVRKNLVYSLLAAGILAFILIR